MDDPRNIKIRGWKMYTKVDTEIERVNTASEPGNQCGQMDEQCGNYMLRKFFGKYNKLKYLIF